MHPVSRALLFVLLFVSLAGPAQAGLIVTPPADLGQPGDAQSPGPLRFYGTGGSRNQVVYNASFFLGAGGPLLIDAVSFRAFSNISSSFFGNSVTASDVIVTLSTTTGGGEGANELSPTFAANVGANVQTVYSGPLTLTTAFTPAAGGTLAFDYTIPFQNPFLYDPSQGNLLLDVEVLPTATVSGNGAFGFVTFDSVNDVNDGIFSVVSNSDGSATSGTLSTAGPITAFQVTPQVTTVPEPATLTIFGAGLALLAVGRFRQRKTGQP